MTHSEIERKFLVSSDAWRGRGKTMSIRQGYLSTDPDRVVRVRIADARGFVTVKGRARGATRTEIEVPIPHTDAVAMLAFAVGSLVEKRRHVIEHAGFAFEVDEFQGDNAGLVIAELEVKREADFDKALASPPEWLGRDVTEDERFANSALARRPFKTWDEAERAGVYGTSSLIERG